MPDLEGRVFRRCGNTLVAADFAADELLQSLPEGREVIVTIRKPRSPQFQRWFFAFLRSVVRKNPDKWRNETELLSDLKDATDHIYPSVINPLTGTLRRPTRSIDFSAMSAAQFKRWKNRTIYILQRSDLNLPSLDAASK